MGTTASRQTDPRINLKGKKQKDFLPVWLPMVCFPSTKMVSSAAGIVLMIQAHRNGWPMVKGGTQQMANAMSAYFVSLGGEIQCGFRVDRLQDLPEARAVLFDLAPKQILKIAGQGFSAFYQNQLEKYRYGMGVFKVDWALDAPIPFLAEDCRKAGTVHLGESFAEIAANENMTMHGGHPRKTFCYPGPANPFRSVKGTGRKTYCLGLLSCSSRIGGGYENSHRETGGTVCTGIPGTHFINPYPECKTAGSIQSELCGW